MTIRRKTKDSDFEPIHFVEWKHGGGTEIGYYESLCGERGEYYDEFRDLHSGDMDRLECRRCHLLYYHSMKGESDE